MEDFARILIVDDNPKYLEEALPMYGYNVTVAEDGVQALKILSKDYSSIDLILLDVMMPNMDGWDTLKAIRTNKNTKYIPVIIFKISAKVVFFASLRIYISYSAITSLLR